MREKDLLNRMRLVLGEIKAQNSKISAKKDGWQDQQVFIEKLHQTHQRLTDQLWELEDKRKKDKHIEGKQPIPEKIIELRVRANGREKGSFFVPEIVEKFEPSETVVGSVNGVNNSEPHDVVGEVVGRKLVLGRDGLVIFDLFCRSKGEKDFDLLQVPGARKHNGVNGLEIVLRRTVLEKDARGLLFTAA